MWHSFSGEVLGIAVQGDDTVPATTRWNKPFLILFFWNTLQVLEVPVGTGLYRVGFCAFDGTVQLREEPVTTHQFAVRVGRESCQFFAIDMEGHEIELKLGRRLPKKELAPTVTLV